MTLLYETTKFDGLATVLASAEAAKRTKTVRAASGERPRPAWKPGGRPGGRGGDAYAYGDRSKLLQPRASISWRGQQETAVTPQVGSDGDALPAEEARVAYVHAAYRRPRSAVR